MPYRRSLRTEQTPTETLMFGAAAVAATAIGAPVAYLLVQGIVFVAACWAAMVGLLP